MRKFFAKFRLAQVLAASCLVVATVGCQPAAESDVSTDLGVEAGDSNTTATAETPAVEAPAGIDAAVDAAVDAVKSSDAAEAAKDAAEGAKDAAVEAAEGAKDAAADAVDAAAEAVEAGAQKVEAAAEAVKSE